MSDRNKIILDDDEAIELPFHMIPIKDFLPDEEQIGLLRRLLPEDESVFSLLKRQHKKAKRKEHEGIIDKSFSVQDFEKIKDRIIVNVINTERNCKMLEEVPHTEVEDLSFIYKIMLTSEEHESATITIKNEHLALWNDVTLEKLHEVAFANSRRLLPVKVESMRNILMRMLNFDDAENDIVNDLKLHEDMGCQMYVISNTMFWHGAAAIFYSDALSKISEELGENLYVLPLSVQEVMVVNEKSGTPEELVEMVKEMVNEVAVEEQLSDHVYCFCAETHEFKIADVA